jgi:hypothetical protein
MATKNGKAAKPGKAKSRKASTAPIAVGEVDGAPAYGDVDARELLDGPYIDMTDVPVVTAEDLDEAERALAEKDAATTSAPLRMHPIVASIVESDPDRYQPMDDYDDERPRCESLPVKLTEEELHSLGDEISELVEKLRRTEEENKQIRKQLGQAEAMLKNEIHGKNAVKRDGKEMRKVPVQSVGNLKSNRRETYRLDTGERVDALSRALSFSEIQDLSQMGLPGIPTSRGGRKA